MREQRGSRREILFRLCASEQTIGALAAELAISRNAVRKNLEQLEQDGLVRHESVRRGVGKPAHEYRITPEGEVVLSRAYLPVLRDLLGVLEGALPGEVLESVMRETGRRLGARAGSVDGTVADRVEAASETLRSLGGVAFVAEGRDGLSIECTCCAIGAIVGQHRSACKAMESMLEEHTSIPVTERCIRSGRPKCRFVFHDASTAPPP